MDTLQLLTQLSLSAKRIQQAIEVLDVNVRLHYDGYKLLLEQALQDYEVKKEGLLDGKEPKDVDSDELDLIELGNPENIVWLELRHDILSSLKKVANIYKSIRDTYYESKVKLEGIESEWSTKEDEDEEIEPPTKKSRDSI